MQPPSYRRRVMNKHHAKHSARFVECRGEAGKLWLAEQAGREKWPGRQRGRKCNERDIRAAAHERKRAAVSTLVAAHVFVPELGRPLPRCRHVDVVVAGDNSHLRGRPDSFEPGTGALVFASGREIDEIAGNGNVVDGLTLNVPRDGLEHVSAMDVFAFAVPIDEA